MYRVIEKGTPISRVQLTEGGTLLVDKPLEWTSFDVVNKLRFAIRHTLGLKKYKIGHAGTLDPLATGLLLLCFSKFTKKIESLMGMNKTYTGTIRMWEETPSFDAEWPPTVYYPRIRYGEDQLEKAAERFVGGYLQAPPVFSAIKKKGVPLYKMARKGIEVEVTKRPVQIHRFKISRVYWPFIDFEVECSKGTYIRSLAYDFGQALGNGAYLSALRRTAIGTYSVERAWTIPDLISAIQDAR